MLPDGEDLNEWIAVNTVDFFNQINMLYGTITEMCTEESCSVMSAGPKYEYHWADGQTVKKPIKCSAPKYIDYLMTWVQDQLDDEILFPSKIGKNNHKYNNKISCMTKYSSHTKSVRLITVWLLCFRYIFFSQCMAVILSVLNGPRKNWTSS